MNLIEKYKKIINVKVKRTFRDRVLSTFGISYPTFYNWVSGKTKPSEYQEKKILDIYNELLNN